MPVLAMFLLLVLYRPSHSVSWEVLSRTDETKFRAEKGSPQKIFHYKLGKVHGLKAPLPHTSGVNASDLHLRIFILRSFGLDEGLQAPSGQPERPEAKELIPQPKPPKDKHTHCHWHSHSHHNPHLPRHP